MYFQVLPIMKVKCTPSPRVTRIFGIPEFRVTRKLRQWDCSGIPVEFRITRGIPHNAYISKKTALVEFRVMRIRVMRIRVTRGLGVPKCLFLQFFSISYYITRKEPKSDDRLSKFDWIDLSLIFLTIMLLHNLQLFQKSIQNHFLAIH